MIGLGASHSHWPLCPWYQLCYFVSLPPGSIATKYSTQEDFSHKILEAISIWPMWDGVEFFWDPYWHFLNPEIDQHVHYLDILQPYTKNWINVTCLIAFSALKHNVIWLVSLWVSPWTLTCHTCYSSLHFQETHYLWVTVVGGYSQMPNKSVGGSQ